MIVLPLLLPAGLPSEYIVSEQPVQPESNHQSEPSPFQAELDQWRREAQDERAANDAINAEIEDIRRRDLKEELKRLQAEADAAEAGRPKSPAELSAECDLWRQRICEMMPHGRVVPRPLGETGAYLRGEAGDFLMPPVWKLYQQASALGLGDPPRFPDGFKTDGDYVRALDSLIAWCKSKAPPQNGDQAEQPPGNTPKLSRRAENAWRYYNSAIESRPDLNETTDRDVYDYLKKTIGSEMDGSEEDGYRLPAFDTWQRYLRTARKAYDCRKHEPRYGRPHGSSIVHADQIETGCEADF